MGFLRWVGIIFGLLILTLVGMFWVLREKPSTATWIV